MLKHNPAGKRSKPLAATLHRRPVAVEAEQPALLARKLQNGLRMTSASQGAIDVTTTRPDFQQADHFPEHDRQMHANLPAVRGWRGEPRHPAANNP